MKRSPEMMISEGLMAHRANEVWPIILEIRNAVNDLYSRSELNPSVGSGLGGSILLNRYMYDVLPDTDFEKSAEDQLDSALDLGGRLALTNLYGGTTGMAWLLTHLSNMDHEEPDVGDLDEILSAVLDQPWQGHYDLISGLVGVGLYALERIPHANGRLILGKVVRQLDELSESQQGSMKSWFTEPRHIPHTQIEEYPDGYYNLGLAHGGAGCIRLLAEAVRNDVEVGVATSLLEGAVPWLYGKLQKNGSSWVLTGHLYTGDGELPKAPKPRLAWCYNELGAMTATLAAGAVCGRKDWIEQGLAVINSTLGLQPETVGCQDACLCHGAAGVAHIYHRLGKEFNQDQYLDEAMQYFEMTLNLHNSGLGCGGYTYSHLAPGSGRHEYVSRAGFLEGSSGIALALLSATYDVDTTWDRLLGLS